jgi:hypothetical protein
MTTLEEKIAIAEQTESKKYEALKLYNRAVDLGLCPICGEKLINYTKRVNKKIDLILFEIPYQTNQANKRCSKDITHYDEEDFYYDDDELDDYS